MITLRHDKMPKNPTQEELIEWMRGEIKRVKIQRNEYEQELAKANKRINQLSSEVSAYEVYINRTKQKSEYKKFWQSPT